MHISAAETGEKTRCRRCLRALKQERETCGKDAWSELELWRSTARTRCRRCFWTFGEVEPEDVTLGAQVNERLDQKSRLQLHTMTSLVALDGQVCELSRRAKGLDKDLLQLRHAIGDLAEVLLKV